MIISIRREGLGNRLKSLVSCFRLEPDDAWIYWPSEINIYLKEDAGKIPHRPPVEFNDLFQNPIAIKKPFPKHARLYDSWRLAILPTDDIPVGFSQSTFSEASPDGRMIDFEYQRISKRVQLAYVKEFEKLIVQPSIKQQLEDFKNKHLPKKYISVHLRSWVDLAAKARRQNFDLPKVIQELKSFGTKPQFFIACDDPKIIEQLVKTFGQQVSYFPSQDRTTINDLIDLYLLAGGSTILGSKDSTFSETAFWLSKANKNFRIL